MRAEDEPVSRYFCLGSGFFFCFAFALFSSSRYNIARPLSLAVAELSMLLGCPEKVLDIYELLSFSFLDFPSTRSFP